MTISLKGQPYNVRLAAHMVGMAGLFHKDPYIKNGKVYFRADVNYIIVGPSTDAYGVLDEMVTQGYATVSGCGWKYAFSLTRKGLDWLGEQLNMKIYDYNEKEID